MSDVVLRVSDLCKSYKTKSGVLVANNHISFELHKEEILAILGPNGAGKSTLIKQIIGYIQPDSGEIELLKQDTKVTDQESLYEIGYMMQSRFEHWDHLSIKDAIYYSARLKKMPKKKINEEMMYLVKKLEIENEINRPMKVLSGGKKQAAALACAVIGQPSILILDEPTTGLDPEKRVVFWRFLKELKHEKHISIIVITHNVAEIEDMVDRVLIVGNSRILKEGSPKELYKEVENEIRIEIGVNGELRGKLKLDSVLESCHQTWNEDGSKLFIYITEERMVDCIAELFRNTTLREAMCSFQIYEPSLEDVYIKIMGEKIN